LHAKITHYQTSEYFDMAKGMDKKKEVKKPKKDKKDK